MPFDPAADARPLMYALERRQQRIQLPDCPACHVPLHVDVRSSDTLYARCQWCGHRRMLAKPETKA